MLNLKGNVRKVRHALGGKEGPRFVTVNAKSVTKKGGGPRNTKKCVTYYSNAAKVILLQCLTRGPSSHRDFFMAMIAIQDISPSALNFVMKIFKVNIACLHQKLRPRISLRQVLQSIGVTLE